MCCPSSGGLDLIVPGVSDSLIGIPDDKQVSYENEQSCDFRETDKGFGIQFEKSSRGLTYQFDLARA